MSQTAYINDTQGVEINWSPNEGISISASEGDLNWNRITTSSKTKVNNMEGDNKMKRWDKIIEVYTNKMMTKYADEKEAKIREVILEDKKIKAFGLKNDSLSNGICNFLFNNLELLDKETTEKCDKIVENWKNKCQALTNKLSEIKAILEMTDTYEQMKEVLLQYGIINWYSESDK